MNELILTCQNEQRRDRIRQQELNGLDYLEVSEDQKSLFVYFIGSLPQNLTIDNVRIEGGQRIRGLQVKQIEPEPKDDPTVDSYLKVMVDHPGDFSTYTLRLVKSKLEPQPPIGFDPRYAQLQFSFKAGCPSDLDCKSEFICPPEEWIEPEINYLAKDYASFRQLLLDRLALIMPDWQERHVPDLGITLIELLAYVGDYLSYYQDAVATEAYLNTARQRISVRRHVRLVDYRMHEGCNARTWVWLDTSEDYPLNNADKLFNLENIEFITSYQNAPPSGTILKSEDLKNISASQYEVFEAIFPQEIKLYKAHNQINFYTWGDRQCCLPKGATSATLRDNWVLPSPPQTKQTSKQKQQPDPCDEPDSPEPPQPERELHLQVGDILIFTEVKGVKTGEEADADPAHRQAVRLIKVELIEDTLYQEGDDQENSTQNLPIPLVEIEWAAEDALPFPLCISAVGTPPECCLIDNISVARGNVILVDYGRKVKDEELGTVSEKESIARCEDEGEPAEIAIAPAVFRPHLKEAPLTFSQPLLEPEIKQAPASRLLKQNPRLALPQVIKLTGTTTDGNNSEETNWIPQLDLLASNSQDPHFVVEMDNDGRAQLRFGDGELGKMPIVGTRFDAIYRLGNGLSGNVGAETISHLVIKETSLSGVTITPHNPFPAQGGTDPEPLAEIKLFAPYAFKKELQRGITAQDYADIVMRDFKTQVQRAAATLRWTGSWYEVLVVIDPLSAETASRELLEAIAQHLYPYRRIGHDLAVKTATYVPLDIAMTVCVKSNYLRGQVKAELLKVFSDRILTDGRRGFFHPDNLTFGEGVTLSKLVATAQAVSGVENAIVTKLQRLAEEPNGEIENGILPLNPLEIARLDNNPNFPEHGKLTLDLRGGR
jgi:hypothetical protein